MKRKPTQVYLSIDERSDGLIQLSIGCHDGAGYRICGPKYDGSGRTIKRHVLTAADAEEIQRYLKLVPRPSPSVSRPSSQSEAK